MPNCKTCKVKISKGKFCGGCAKANAASGVEAAQLRANRRTADTSVGTDGVGTVRLQLQINGKATDQDKKNYEASRTVESAGGVSVTALDAAFEVMVTRWSANGTLKAQARAAYEMHKERWGTYTVGNSYSINFDKSTITVGGRPPGGYRLDVENIRVGSGPNFI